MDKYKQGFQEDQERLKEYAKMLLSGPLKTAIDLAFSANTPNRFEKNTLCGNDYTVKKASELDQITGWNDCIQFLLSLSKLPKPHTASQALEAYDEDYVERIDKEKRSQG